MAKVELEKEAVEQEPLRGPPLHGDLLSKPFDRLWPNLLTLGIPAVVQPEGKLIAAPHRHSSPPLQELLSPNEVSDPQEQPKARFLHICLFLGVHHGVSSYAIATVPRSGTGEVAQA